MNNIQLAKDKPKVMCFSGLDPSGGAGIQADIEALFSTGCHCLPMITTLTVQDTQNAKSQCITDSNFLIEQARTILEDIPIQAFKIGLVGDVANIQVIHTLLKDYADIPVILDPILAAGGGYEFSSEKIVDAICSLLLPLTTVLTPNTEEIRRLSPSSDSLEACATEILDGGCKSILLTGTHTKSKEVINRLFSQHRQVKSYSWRRLKSNYHGSGCTLAASLAGYLAHQVELSDAVQQAQRFTWESLEHGGRLGFGQLVPNRSFWNSNE